MTLAPALHRKRIGEKDINLLLQQYLFLSIVLGLSCSPVLQNRKGELWSDVYNLEEFFKGVYFPKIN